MLMKRICPLCKSSLSLSSVYFCEYCGSVLPEDMHMDRSNEQSIEDNFQKKVEVKKNNPKSPKVKSGSHIRFSNIIAGIILGVSLSLAFFLLFSPDSLQIKIPISLGNSIVVNSRVEEPIVPETQPATNISDEYLEMGLKLGSGAFGQNDVYSYVPYESRVFIEFNDISSLEPYFGFIGGELFTLVENIRGQISTSYSAFYLNKGLKGGWVVITFPIADDIELGSLSEVYADKVDGALVISQFPEFIDEVRLARSGVSKNLDVHPVLISIKSLIPSNGQIFILKTCSEGDGVVEDLIRQTLSDELKLIMTRFRDKETTYLVIK